MVEASESPKHCTTCGGPIVPAAELYRQAWEAGLGKDDSRYLQMLLLKIGIQLGHRLGRCAQRRVCPALDMHIGSSLAPGEVPRCGLCGNEVSIDRNGLISNHLVGPRLGLGDR